MNHLILGSAGQIGMALADYLKSLGEIVQGFDIVSNPEQDLRKDGNPALLAALQDADFVYFLAFDVGGSRYLKTYQHEYQFLSNNAQLMESTFSALRETEKPFIFASSQMSNMAYSPYGILKALGESYTHSLGGLVVKFWNVYGVEHDLEKSHVVTDFLLKAKQSGTIDMMTDGTELRQFLHAEDCSRCLHTLASKYEDVDRSQELHITNFAWSTIREVADIVRGLFPGSSVLPGQSSDEVQKDKRNEPNEFILRYWTPKISLPEGIRMVKDGLGL